MTARDILTALLPSSSSSSSSGSPSSLLSVSLVALLAVFLLTAGLVLTLHMLSAVVPPAAYYARCLASVIALLVCAFYGTVASAALQVFGYGGLGQWTTGRSFKWLMWGVTGVGYEVVEGQEHLKERPAVFVGNHQTYVIIWVSICREVKGHYLLGLWCWRVKGCEVWLGRGERGGISRQMRYEKIPKCIPMRMHHLGYIGRMC